MGHLVWFFDTAALAGGSLLLLIGFGAVLVHASIDDARHMSIADGSLVGASVLSLAALLCDGVPGVSLRDHVAGAVFMSGLLFVVRKVIGRVLGREALGPADVLLGFALGGWVGIGAVAWTLEMSALIGLVGFIARRRLGARLEEDPTVAGAMGFVPFLSAGTIAVGGLDWLGFTVSWGGPFAWSS